VDSHIQNDEVCSSIFLLSLRMKARVIAGPQDFVLNAYLLFFTKTTSKSIKLSVHETFVLMQF